MPTLEDNFTVFIVIKDENHNNAILEAQVYVDDSDFEDSTYQNFSVEEAIKLIAKLRKYAESIGSKELRK